MRALSVRLTPAILLLLSACATVPPVAQAPVAIPAPPPPPSRLGTLDNSTGYVGDCFAGFFRPDAAKKADGSTAWVLIDPFDGTGEVQLDGHHLILKRTASTGEIGKIGAKIHDHYHGASPQLDIDLDYTNLKKDSQGVFILEGDISLSAGSHSEKVHVKGHAAC